jgi:uncharacterized protein (TIGR02145 family)
MHTYTLILRITTIIVAISILSSCLEESEPDIYNVEQEIKVTLATDCYNDCFEEGGPYPEKEFQTTVWWGNRKFSKTVNMIIYNTSDSVFFRLKSSHTAATIKISFLDDELERYVEDTPLPAETWTEEGFALPSVWKSCDTMEVEIEVNGHGPAAVFTVSYHLVEACGSNLTVKDVDGNVYPVLKFGSQHWMAENLKVTRYRNGDLIPNNLDGMQWNYTTEGATAVNDYWSYEDFDDLNDVVAVFGRHYNWFAVTDSRGLCPDGWKVPADEDWDQLVDFLTNQNNDVTADNLGLHLKSTTRWGYFEEDYNGTNAFKFNALPAGYIEYPHKISWDMAYYAGWWSSTASNRDIASSRYIIYFRDQLIKGGSPVQTGKSIRCIKG